MVFAKKNSRLARRVAEFAGNETVANRSEQRQLREGVHDETGPSRRHNPSHAHVPTTAGTASVFSRATAAVHRYDIRRASRTSRDAMAGGDENAGVTVGLARTPIRHALAESTNDVAPNSAAKLASFKGR